MPHPRCLVIGLSLAALIPVAKAKSLSVNLTPRPSTTAGPVDAQIVDPDEVALVGIAGAETIGGTDWNNIRLRDEADPSNGVPSVFVTNTQGGNHLDLIDSSGTDSGIDLTSDGAFFSNYGNASTPNQSATGDGGLMQGYLNMFSTETISLSGLSAWAPNGYKVYAVFDIGPLDRTYGVSMTDGTTSQIFWTADTAGTDSDANNDGVIEWLETTATTSGTAVTDANYAVYGTFTGDTLTISGDATAGRATLNGFQIVALPTGPVPDALSLNFGITLDDANAVDFNESSAVGLTGAATVAGSGWNNVLLLPSGFGAPSTFTAATQGGNHLDLSDAAGSDAGVDLTSSGGLFSNFGNVSSPNEASTGDAGLLQSFLLLNDTESVSLDGLAAWAPNGYRVRAFFDIGPNTRTYGITMQDGGSPQTFWTADSAGTDADPDNDGVITWIETTATTEGTAVADANFALFGPFTGDTLTVSGISTAGRAALSGIQIIPNTDPLPTIVSFTATPPSFTSGQTVTLAWEVTDADSVSIDQTIGTVAATDTLDLTPSATTTWTLTAIRGTSQITAQATATLSLGPIDVYLLGGQSNMQGTARTSKLPAELLLIPEIRLYVAGSGISGGIANQWVDLQPSNGSTFGPEIGIGQKMRDLCPGNPIALLKYSASGNSLEIDFKPGANAADTANWGASFTAIVNTYNNGLAALEAEGWDPVIKGMCWQQGEQDAKDGLNVAESNTSADDYGANLSHFVDRVREQFAAYAAPGGIRFAPGQVLPYAPPGGDVATRFPGRDLVRQAILDADEDSGAPLSISNTRAVATNSTDHPTHAQDGDGFKDTDEVHLNATAQLALGRSMAYAMLDLDPVSYLDWAGSFSLVGGPDDDDDGDGLNNRLEYLLAGHPMDANDTPHPLLSFPELEGNPTPTYTLTRNLEAPDFSPEVQFSYDLLDWDSNPPTFVSSVKQNDGTAILLFLGPSLLNDPSHPKGFFRTEAK